MQKAVEEAPGALRVRPFRVGVFGHYGQLNLGDESLTTAVIASVRRLAPHAEITGFSLNPEDTTARHGVPAVAIRSRAAHVPIEKPAAAQLSEAGGRDGGVRGALKNIRWLKATYYFIHRLPSTLVAIVREIGFIAGAWRAVGKVDLLIVAGSNQMIDYVGGTWGFPYTLFKWATLARLRGVKLAFLGVGAGPLDGRLARRFVRWSLKAAQFVSVRDAGSRRLVQELGYRGEIQVSPDLAFSVPWNATGSVPRAAGPRVIAVNPMPIYDARYWPVADPVRYGNYVQALADVCSTLLAAGDRLVFFSTQPADEWVADDVIERMSASARTSGRYEIARMRSLERMLEGIAACDYAVATRFHGILLSLLVGTPVIGICYYRKSRELMESLGVGEFAMDIDRIEAADLAARLGRLAARRGEIESKVRAGVMANRAELERQYEAILKVTGGPRG